MWWTHEDFAFAVWKQYQMVAMHFRERFGLALKPRLPFRIAAEARKFYRDRQLSPK